MKKWWENAWAAGVLAVLVGMLTVLVGVLVPPQAVSAQGDSIDEAEPAIINGTDVMVGEFPHLVGIIFSGSTECGGSLIADTWVVSAAHCFDGETTATVQIGFGSPNKTTYTQTIGITRIVQHPGWGDAASALTNDIALVELVNAPDMSGPEVGLIPLNTDTAMPAVGATVTVAGWGDTDGSEPGTNFPDVARKADIQVVACGGTDDEAQVCAIGDTTGTDACGNDSGGPLVLQGASGLILVGTVESGPNDGTCGGASGPGIYQRISTQAEWLNDTIGAAPEATCNDLAVTATVTEGVPFVGSAGDDVILGTPGDDDISGGGGNDTICALAGDDDVYGDDGDDWISGDDGRDFIFGGPGIDTIYGGLMIDRIWGNAGDDVIYGEGGSDRIRAGSGNDEVLAGSGADRVWGGFGDDTLLGMGGQDFMFGQAGDDIMQGNFQSDRLRGGDGNDTIRGAGGKDKLYGDGGDDMLFGGNNTDYLEGGDGVDTANGQQGKDNPLVPDISGCDAETLISC